MTKLLNCILTSALILGASVPTLAGTPVVNSRERHQQRWIVQGVRSGELSAVEVVRLELQQARIRRHEAQARSDGVVTVRERVQLHRALNRSSRRIEYQKHD